MPMNAIVRVGTSLDTQIRGEEVPAVVLAQRADVEDVGHDNSPTDLSAETMRLSAAEMKSSSR